MKREEITQLLGYPLYGLYHIRTLEESEQGGYLYDIVPGFSEQHPEERQGRIIQAMEEALADPDLDLTDVLPELRFGQEDIRKHLEITLKRLKA